MSNPDLIARARQRDETAWETLVRENQEAAFRRAKLANGMICTPQAQVA